MKCLNSLCTVFITNHQCSVCDSKGIANVNNKFFTNIEDKLADNPFSMKLIDVVFAMKEIKAHDMTKSTGYDGIPARLLKASAASTDRALTHIFNRTVVSGSHLVSGKHLELHKFTRRVTHVMLAIIDTLSFC